MIPLEKYNNAISSNNVVLYESYLDCMNVPGIIGEYNDIIIVNGDIIKETGWKKNLIVASFGKLLAALCKSQPGFTGITYWEVGSGLSSWDNAPPSPQVSDTSLTTPLARVPVNVFFLDQGNNRVTQITNKIEMEATFSENVANGPLREFGVFGGDATSQLGSGIMCDRVIHPVFNKTNNMVLVRKLRFTF